MIKHLPGGGRGYGVFSASAVVVAHRARVRAKGKVTYPDGTVVEPPPPEPWEAILELADHDERVEMTMAYLALPPSWHRLYAALDAPRKDSRTGGRQGIIDRGASAGELNRFTHTADHYKAVGVEARHASPDRKPPKDPMTLEEGAEFVRGVVAA